MKRKIILALAMVAMLACLFAVSVSANEIDYTEKAILADGTVLPIYDANNNPLIWYVKDANATGVDKYASVPNNRTAPNANNDTYVTYTINTGWMTQLENINIHIWNETNGAYDVVTEEGCQAVVVNLRGLTDFVYLHSGFKVSDIQYIYFNEGLKDFCEYFKGSTAIRLVDLSVCTSLTGGFGGTRNLYNCKNLHTIRLAPGSSYALTCSKNHNWRFSGTAIKELVVPGNVTSLGIDNFNSCAQLESIYLLGSTSLGQRNFLGCSKLTSIYVLDANPTISADDFKYNFLECMDGNTKRDFSDIGKYFFFVTENESYLNSIQSAIGGTVISYNDYKANPSNYEDGRYIISGTNICDVLYDGKHSVPDSENSCVGNCTKCGALAPTENPVHNFEGHQTLVYSDYSGYGVLTQICQNEGCIYSGNTPNVVTNIAPIISKIKGYATSEDGKEITFGYDIDTDALAYYNEITGKALELGFVVAVNAYLDGAPLNSNGTEATLAKGKVVKTATNAVYSSVDFRLTGNWNDNITIGDEETQLKYVELFIAGYIFDGAVNYVNNEGSSADYTSVIAVTHTKKPVEA